MTGGRAFILIGCLTCSANGAGAKPAQPVAAQPGWRGHGFSATTLPSRQT